MLKDDLLLDSASPFSGDTKIGHGCPEHSSQGVLSSCQEVAMHTQWYVLRVSYSRELKIKSVLDERGVRTFVPMMWKKTETAGKVERKYVPAVSNLCFVFWTKPAIDSFISEYGDRSPVHYYWDRTAGRPMTVPEKAMEDFVKVSSSMDEDIIYLTQISEKLREGQVVRVRSGSFAGVEGRIVRLRKSRRLMVELPGMLAVASTFIRPEDIEII